MSRNQPQQQQRLIAATQASMPKLSNKQLFDLLRIHEENLAALRDCATKPAKFEQDLYEEMCRSMQQRYNIKLSPIGMRSQVWRLKERVERKVNAAACKSGSTDEEYLLKTASFTPVEAHLYKLLTDKVLPLVIKDQREHQREHHSRSRASHPDDSSVAETPVATPTPTKKGTKPSPTKSETPRKKGGKAAGATDASAATQNTNATPATTTQPPAQTTTDEPPAKKKRSHKKKQPVLAPPASGLEQEVVAHSEPESTTVDAYMDTIERVAQMGRTAPGWYDEHLLDIRLPNLYMEEPVEKKKKPSKKKKGASEESKTETKTEKNTPNGKPAVDRDQYLLNLKLDPAALGISTDDLMNRPTNGPVDELQKEKQLLCRTQRLLAAQSVALQTRQAEMIESQTKFYDAWSGLASTFSSFFNFLPAPPTIVPPTPAAPKRKSPSKAKQQQVQAQQAA